ncbi:MAG: histidinol dehydrogenase, partial [Lachnospiraceae bacterium]|nr:histidinol dehydrogenase [Lachnospiraceae bacterium]
MRIVNLTNETKQNLLENLLKRSTNDYGDYEAIVADIIENVKTRKEEAIFEYSLKFDKCLTTKETFQVTKAEIDAAYAEIDAQFIQVMKASAENIRVYHEKQKRNSWFDAKEDGTILGQKITPMQTVGVYVPGGKAAYPSTTLMNVIPAKVAGVPNIIMTTPAGANGKVNPATLVAADIAGVDMIFKTGGAQAIAALAYGTQLIPKVDKIVGPGNIFVALAKRAVYGHVSIDSIAGPSEILVLADESATPRYVAADLLSQAEHDELASAILITTSAELAKQVSDEVDKFVEVLERKAIIQESLNNYGYI